MDIPLHPSHKVIDSSKIEAYTTCPRKYFFRYILNWAPEGKAHDLFFGECFHTGMEIMLQSLIQHGQYTDESVEAAFKAFEEKYRSEFPPDTDDIYSPKTPNYAKIAYSEYANLNRVESFIVKNIEVAGRVLVGQDKDGEDRLLTFRLDAVIEDEQGIRVMDHKTSKMNIETRTWADQWRLSFQLGTYIHALYSYLGYDNVVGAVVNGFQFRETPKTDRGWKDRTTVHNYCRVRVQKNKNHMQSWLEDINRILDDMDYDMVLLDSCTPDSPVMSAFQRRPKYACTSYNRTCPFIDFCESWANPLQNVEIDGDIVRPEIGFQIEPWDPTKLSIGGE